MKKNWKPMLIGLLMIVVAIGGLLIAFLDGDPDTKPDVGKAIEQVKEGVEMIKDAQEVEEQVAPVTPADSPTDAVIDSSTGSSQFGRSQRIARHLIDVCRCHSQIVRSTGSGRFAGAVI